MRHLRNIINFAIFFLQGTLAVLFFFSLGSSLWDSLFLAAMGAILEMVKRQCWIDWKATTKNRHWLALTLGVVLSVVSAFASLSFSYTAIQTSTRGQSTLSADRRTLEKQVAGLDAESNALREKLAALPGDWVTSSLRYSTRLAELSRERTALLGQLGELGKPGSSSGSGAGALTIGDLCALVGVNYDRFLVVFLAVITVVLEVATFALLPGTRGVQSASQVSRVSLILEASFQGEGRPLRGRRKVAEDLGLPEAEVRKAIAKVQRMGLVEGREGVRGLYLNRNFSEVISLVFSNDNAGPIQKYGS